VVRASGRKVLIWMLMLAGSFFLVLAYARMPTLSSGSLHGLEPPDTPPVRAVITAGALSLLLAFAARHVSWLFTPSPVLVMTRQGIGVHAWLFGTGMLPWSQIAVVRVTRLVHFCVLRIEVRDWQVVRAQQNHVQALLYRLSGWALQWPRTVVINDTVIAKPLQALLHQVWQLYQAEMTHYGVQIPHSD
jgi:hypothetical protein